MKQPKPKVEVFETEYKGISILTITEYGVMGDELMKKIDKDVQKSDIMLQVHTVELDAIHHLIDVLLENETTIISIRRYPTNVEGNDNITMIGVKGITEEDFRTISKGDFYI